MQGSGPARVSEQQAGRQAWRILFFYHNYSALWKDMKTGGPDPKNMRPWRVEEQKRRSIQSGFTRGDVAAGFLVLVFFFFQPITQTQFDQSVVWRLASVAVQCGVLVLGWNKNLQPQGPLWTRFETPAIQSSKNPFFAAISFHCKYAFYHLMAAVFLGRQFFP